MMFIDDVIIDQVLDEMPTDFNTHHFVQRLMRLYPSDCVEELREQRDTRDPAVALHPLVAQTLAQHRHVRCVERIASPQPGGESWQKE
jgi:hypothetical protein